MTISRSTALALALLAVSCGTTPIRHYQPRIMTDDVERVSEPQANVVLAVRMFSEDAAYDDHRIVYRESEVRFDYYHYHRWAAEPGKMVSSVLREVYRRSGRFRNVTGGDALRASVTLGGRVVALEEVDVSKNEWQARLELELTLRDDQRGTIIWSQLISDSEPLKERSPDGLAHALSVMLTRIGNETAPVIARQAAAVTSAR